MFLLLVSECTTEPHHCVCTERERSELLLTAGWRLFSHGILSARPRLQDQVFRALIGNESGTFLPITSPCAVSRICIILLWLSNVQTLYAWKLVSFCTELETVVSGFQVGYNTSRKSSPLLMFHPVYIGFTLNQTYCKNDPRVYKVWYEI